MPLARRSARAVLSTPAVPPIAGITTVPGTWPSWLPSSLVSAASSPGRPAKCATGASSSRGMTGPACPECHAGYGRCGVRLRRIQGGIAAEDLPVQLRSPMAAITKAATEPFFAIMPTTLVRSFARQGKYPGKDASHGDTRTSEASRPVPPRRPSLRRPAKQQRDGLLLRFSPLARGSATLLRGGSLGVLGCVKVPGRASVASLPAARAAVRLAALGPVPRRAGPTAGRPSWAAPTVPAYTARAGRAAGAVFVPRTKSRAGAIRVCAVPGLVQRADSPTGAGPSGSRGARGRTGW